MSGIHFVVDDKEVLQLATTYKVVGHVGDPAIHPNMKYFNRDCIGIEICVNSDGNYQKARENTIWLTKQIMKTEHIKKENIIRHYESWGKHCPATMLDHPELWVDFKAQLDSKFKQIINNVLYPILSKNSKDKKNVVKLQKKLNKYGYGLKTDGIFGDDTYKDVILFQKHKKLAIDGVAGASTWKALK